MRTRAVAALIVVLALAAGCSGDPEPASTVAATSASATPTQTPTPDVVVEGADEQLTAAVAEVYEGKTGITAEAHLGTWKKEKVAVVTSGDDVTLAVGPTWKVVGGWWPSLDKEPQLGKGPRFVLVIGSDARSDESLEGTRGDTLQIIGVDGKGGGGVMGLARDIWAPMPGGGKAKLNAAFAFGGGKGQVSSVKEVTGLPIEGYVVTGFKGFKAIVKGNDGVPMDIAKTLVFLKKQTIKKGKRTLDAKTALRYVRERKSLPDGDFGRSYNQGDMLLQAAVAARISGVDILAKEMTLVSKNAESDMSAEDVLTFVASFYKLDPGKVGHEVAKGGFGTSSDGQSIVVLDADSKANFRKFRDGRL
ncbi:LCP family protein [Phycicoccus sp. CSK15P-2]|uniref:LCP family protein n=1 Tax=Phycicoccus sp. CSK15P-2 TaxID=2807627 RepID=UPI00194E43FC|nr:LCP family protein [Phycicoccus sp. CSK15P-2]MBM6403166.1 LCP family protein [Phycicoccus sp. CSK15P-2]